jgi:hypothetical protein
MSLLSDYLPSKLGQSVHLHPQDVEREKQRQKSYLDSVLLHSHLENYNPWERIGVTSMVGDLERDHDIYRLWYEDTLHQNKIFNSMTSGCLMNREFRHNVSSTIFVTPGNAWNIINDDDRIEENDWRRSFQVRMNRDKPNMNSMKGGVVYEKPTITTLMSKYFQKEDRFFKPTHVIHPRVPWMSVAPDGIIVIGNGQESKEIVLVEVKSFVRFDNISQLVCRSHHTGSQRPSHVPFYRPGIFNTNWKGYLQIQLSLLVCNLDRCALMIHLSNSDHLFWVNFDQDFVSRKMNELQSSFFQNVFPYLVENSKEKNLDTITPTRDSIID